MRLQTRFLAYFAALAAVILALAFLLVDETLGDVLLEPAPRRLMRLALRRRPRGAGQDRGRGPAA